jgi:F0F1-type ATP synthase assembly protein I
MNELANQVGSLADFQNMNIIAQKSLAEAFGMSREEMSEMLIKQEAINKYGSEASKLNKEQLEYMEKHNMSAAEMLEKVDNQRSAQEKFNDAMTKLQDLIGNLVAGPLGGFIDGMANLSKHATILYGIMGALAGLSLVKTIGSLATMATTLAASSVGAITLSSALTFGLSTVAILASVGALVGAMSSATKEAQSNAQQVHDGIAPSSKGPFTITDSFGATSITAKGDGIAVSPNINKGGNNDLSPMIAAINEVREAIKNLEKRPAVAYINGKDAFARNLGTVSALGTSQIQNSYKLA